MLRTKSQYFKDGRFRNNMEAHNMALQLGVEMLEDYYQGIEDQAQALTTSQAQGNSGHDRDTAATHRTS